MSWKAAGTGAVDLVVLVDEDDEEDDEEKRELALDERLDERRELALDESDPRNTSLSKSSYRSASNTNWSS